MNDRKAWFLALLPGITGGLFLDQVAIRILGPISEGRILDLTTPALWILASIVVVLPLSLIMRVYLRLLATRILVLSFFWGIVVFFLSGHITAWGRCLSLCAPRVEERYADEEDGIRKTDMLIETCEKVCDKY